MVTGRAPGERDLYSRYKFAKEREGRTGQPKVPGCYGRISGPAASPHIGRCKIFGTPFLRRGEALVTLKIGNRYRSRGGRETTELWWSIYTEPPFVFAGYFIGDQKPT
jgi:hypothetical protein